ncbi:MAG: DUF6089 family protein [Crocinitomicaceae bacterium]|nr:DUF6089 family protein [Crocinitomicaceae bacterium]
MKVFFVILICVFGLNFSSIAQFQTALSRSELGVMLGGSYYIGDLNRFKHFKGTLPAAGLIYRYDIHSRLSFRANFSYGMVQGNDEWSKEASINNRNLNFQSSIFELGAGVEFHYVPFQLGSKRYKGTAYLLAELAVFRMNPKTKYNDEWVFLRPLGTEGQGSDLSTKKPYSLFQLSVPLGLGVKLSLGKRVALGLEYGIRLTFTDYLDDVKSDTYVDPIALSEANGPTAAALSNRSKDGSVFGKRGTSTTKDWYSFFGVTLTFRLGDPQKCAFME